MEKLTNISEAEITFGTQLDSLLMRHNDFKQFPHSVDGISKQYPDLAGHEMGLIKAVGNAVCERMDTMRALGIDGLATEILESRKNMIGS